MSFYDHYGDGLGELKGKVVKDCRISPDKDALVFVLEDETPMAFETYGDCCSKSWIEHVEIGYGPWPARISRTRDRRILGYAHSDHDWLQVYAVDVLTEGQGGSSGQFVIEYRNASNGYYGGSIQATREIPAGWETWPKLEAM